MQNHIVTEMIPNEVYLRHSEGAFLRLKDDGILFVYSRFSGSTSDDAASDLVKCISYDEGESWSEPVLCLPAAQFGVKNIMSVSLLRMQNGEVGMFYIVKEKAGVTTIMLSRSKDEGEHFDRHIVCSLADRPGYYVLNNDRVERLSDGRLIIPLAFHRGAFDSTGSGKYYFDSRGVGCWLISDDDGYTWHEAADTVYPPFTGSDSGLQEGGVLEKEDGTLWGYFRTDRGYQYECFSHDGGERWTTPQPSRFSSPCSPMKMKRDEEGNIYAVWNPIPNYTGRKLYPASWGRTPLVYAVSKDDGKTWSEPLAIASEENHGYCYPALFSTKDQALLIAYCAGGPEDYGCCLARLIIQKCHLL